MDAHDHVVLYTASEPVNQISFDTNSGSRWNLHADMGSPLPASTELCQSSDGACVSGGPLGRRVDSIPDE